MGPDRQALKIIERFRVDIVANLLFTWSNEDLAQPIMHHLVIASAPSPTKDALANGLLAGDLRATGHSLSGELELTALGRLAVRRMRKRVGMN